MTLSAPFLGLMMLTAQDSSVTSQALDHAEIGRLIADHEIPGLAVALTEGGSVVATHAYGYANREEKTPLGTDSVLYGASWTKSLFSMFVMQQVETGLLDLDTPIEAYLKKPLPEYRRFTDLADEPRWRQLTMRMLLGHTTGFPNYRFFPPPGPNLTRMESSNSSVTRARATAIRVRAIISHNR